MIGEPPPTACEVCGKIFVAPSEITMAAKMHTHMIVNHDPADQRESAVIDAQQENGTDEAPDRDVRWEGKLARLQTKAEAWTGVNAIYPEKMIEVEAGVLERLIRERNEPVPRESGRWQRGR